jgi:starch synthase
VGDVGWPDAHAPTGRVAGRWLAGRLGNDVALRLLDVPGLYEGPALYAANDEDAARFIALGRAAAILALREKVDVLVAHDWHAALAVGSLRWAPPAAEAAAIGVVQVVHNGAHIGRFGAREMERTGLPPPAFAVEGVEFFGDLCLLKAGLMPGDRIVAVSPRYAQELGSPAFGGGLDGVYRSRADRLVGIANGIDAERFDPATDGALACRFSAEAPKGRVACRRALCEELGLAPPRRGRLLAAVGRLTEQKGWDVIADALDRLVADGASVALLGDGDPALAARLEKATRAHPGRVAFVRGWNEPLSRRLYAGADAVLVPSRFEPCGLVQLLAQRYGALPVAHRVGGLVDTIEDGASGVLFEPLGVEPLVSAVERAVSLLGAADASALPRRLMRLDVSWSTPAVRWERLLAQVAREARARV